MPTAIGHAAPALALYPLFSAHVPPRLWLLGVACAMAPDLDVIAFRFGIPYEHWLGHRGLWHSIPFAALFAALLTLAMAWRARPGVSRLATFAYLFLATASHGLLDALTNGGLGIALLSPFDTTRYFAPFRPIEVSPLGIGPFLSSRGVAVLLSELVWVWAPFAVLAGLRLLAAGRGRRPPTAAPPRNP